jgi:DMSO/TMAO reductase YedYZ heme-binding membrane subunit
MDAEILWYVARSGGLIAWGLLALSVIWGLALSTKVMKGRPRPAWLLDLHRFLGGTALVFTAIHVISISLDTYVHFGPIELVVPFTGSWHPVAVAWGILGFYALLAIEITSLLRRRISKRVWRSTHYLAFPLFALTTVHALSAGTDRHTFAVRLAGLSATAVILALTGLRVLQSSPSGRQPPGRQPPRRQPPRPQPPRPPAPLVARVSSS